MVALATGASAANLPLSVIDDTGQQLTLQQPARRIISLSPHLTELLYSAGAGDHIVGTVQWSNFPPAAGKIPRIGNTYSLDMEKIVSLRPDLVVAWQSGNGEQNIDRLRALGLPVYVSEPHALDTIGKTIQQLGRLAGTGNAANSAAKNFLDKLRELRETYSSRRNVSVFYQIWNRPMFTVNHEHVISNIIKLCGGTNVFADLHALSPRIDTEAVLAADPDVIIASGVDARRPSWLNDWFRWPALTAVRYGLIFSIPPDLIQRHTARILEGAAMLCRDLDQARAQLSEDAGPGADHPGK